MNANVFSENVLEVYCISDKKQQADKHKFCTTYLSKEEPVT